jgi:hypothetical protein
MSAPISGPSGMKLTLFEVRVRVSIWQCGARGRHCGETSLENVRNDETEGSGMIVQGAFQQAGRVSHATINGRAVSELEF